ncbi:radical SAM protein [Peterkaempfera bronchialis]|uniref:Radical SAM protein n=1 Tax=Peterkaempfera bronchialis TaxID=2126346 RepID=A0A345SXR8_9ACTN|nr:radical SAM protein [Peterkaempfera bronchialis]AXI78523.1 radical SAM protein [Peterkaempfera bronchialis]
MRSVILSAGKSCFVACPGCYNYFGRTIAETPQVLRFAAGLRDRFGIEKITVGGGDPLTRPDIVTLLTSLHDLGLRIHLDTVGTAFLGTARIRFMGTGAVDQVAADEVAAVSDLIGIPLDGSTDAVQQQFRRHATVASQLAVLSLLDKVGARICVNTVVHSGNTGDIAPLAGLLGGFVGIVEWQLFQFMPIGPLGHRNRERYLISEGDFQHAVAVARDNAPGHVRIAAKSAGGRKHRYLLIDSAGLVWTPEQSQAAVWHSEDANDRRHLIGNVSDADILDRLAVLKNADEEVPA